MAQSRVLPERCGNAYNPPVAKAKNPHAVALGRKGGLKGGKARFAAMTAEERHALARKAARARWAKAKKA